MKTNKLFFGFVTSFLAVVGFVLADVADGDAGMGSMMHSWSFGIMGLFGWLLSILIITALVLLIIWLIKQIQKNGKEPIIVGGSGLYIKAIIDGIFDVGSSTEYRESLMLLRQKNGNEYLYSKLKKADPQSAGKMLPSNWKRVIRALEVLHVTGKPIWQAQEEHLRKANIDFVQFGLNWERTVLYQNIDSRVEQMVQDGLVEEVKNILSNGYSTELNSLNTVGYKEIISYLKNEISLERAVELIKRNTRRFAKRQMTWFRKIGRAHV